MACCTLKANILSKAGHDQLPISLTQHCSILIEQLILADKNNLFLHWTLFYCFDVLKEKPRAACLMLIQIVWGYFMADA